MHQPLREDNTSRTWDCCILADHTISHTRDPADCLLNYPTTVPERSPQSGFPLVVPRKSAEITHDITIRYKINLILLLKLKSRGFHFRVVHENFYSRRNSSQCDKWWEMKTIFSAISFPYSAFYLYPKLTVQAQWSVRINSAYMDVIRAFSNTYLEGILNICFLQKKGLHVQLAACFHRKSGFYFSQCSRIGFHSMSSHYSGKYGSVYPSNQIS